MNFKWLFEKNAQGQSGYECVIKAAPSAATEIKKTVSTYGAIAVIAGLWGMALGTAFSRAAYQRLVVETDQPSYVQTVDMRQIKEQGDQFIALGALYSMLGGWSLAGVALVGLFGLKSAQRGKTQWQTEPPKP